jgi:hypothetical protein
VYFEMLPAVRLMIMIYYHLATLKLNLNNYILNFIMYLSKYYLKSKQRHYQKSESERCFTSLDSIDRALFLVVDSPIIVNYALIFS